MKSKILEFIQSKKGKDLFNDFYGKDIKIHEKQKKRYLSLYNDFYKLFKVKSINYFSTPGRIEIIGNHTDHNLGRVAAAGITLDSIAVANQTYDSLITIYSTYNNNRITVNLNDLEFINGEDSTKALIRGVAAGFIKRKYLIGGFNALIDSEVLPGSGLSSSAAFEVLLGTIINYFFNEDKIDPIEIAKIGQFAENNYMKKPCGLMDQTACAVGGFITIDFIKKDKPVVNKLNFDFSKYDYSILIIDTGGSHENLTPFYASIPQEMKKVAAFFNKNVLREVKFEKIKSSINAVSKKIGDRAVLRSLHFFDENKRVSEFVKALKNKNFKSFLDLINKSGNSSWKYLQNCYVPSTPTDQRTTLGLAITEQFIEKTGQGACRIHGGGFAGTILVFLPNKHIKEYILMIEKVFGTGSAKILSVRQNKSMKII